MDVRIGISDSVHEGSAIGDDHALRRETQMQPFDGIQRGAGSHTGGLEHADVETDESPTVSILRWS